MWKDWNKYPTKQNNQKEMHFMGICKKQWLAIYATCNKTIENAFIRKGEQQYGI